MSSESENDRLLIGLGYTPERPGHDTLVYDELENSVESNGFRKRSFETLKFGEDQKEGFQKILENDAEGYEHTTVIMETGEYSEAFEAVPETEGFTAQYSVF